MYPTILPTSSAPLQRIDVTIGIGVTRDGTPIADAEDRLVALKRTAGVLLGGYTLTRADGGWWDGGKLVEEPAVVFTFYAELSPVGAEHSDVWVRGFIREALDLLDQQSVVLCVNNRAQFVERSAR